MSRVPRLLFLLIVCSLAPIAVAAQQPPPPPDLRLTLTSAPDVVHPGDLLTYTAKIANTSGYDASSVALRWVLPGPVVATTCGTPDNMFCSFPAIWAGATQTVTRTIRVDAAAGAQLLASATVSSPFINPQTDSATLSTTVGETPQADVAIVVDAAPSAVQQGDIVTYTLRVTNDGTSSAASDVAVNFFLPIGLTFLSASPGCTGTSGIICTVGTLNSGSSTAFSVTARAVEPGSITATATVSTTSPEVITGNNSGSATIFVDAAPPPARRRAARH